MNRPYITRTAAELIDAYCYEHGRIDPKDKATTQRLIKQELKERFEGMMRQLDNPELADHPERIYEYFTHEYGGRK